MATRIKKTQPTKGKTPPPPYGIALLENLLTQAEKIPGHLSHPYTRATPSHVSVGQGLKPVLWCVEGRGDFLTRAEICSQMESNSEPLELLLGAPTIMLQALSLLVYGFSSSEAWQNHSQMRYQNLQGCHSIKYKH
jgi:hypothetical protein